MKIYISINGVLRNLVEKFEFHYKDYYLETKEDNDNPFEYKIVEPICCEKLQDSFIFQSKDEFDEFIYMEYPLEIFGHSRLSYMSVVNDLVEFIIDHKDDEIYLIGMDELGKSKPGTFFFLSRNGFNVKNVRFIITDDIKNEWEKCDLWITDDKNIIDLCPDGKSVIKFKTEYNEHFTCKNEISDLKKIKEIWP